MMINQRLRRRFSAVFPDITTTTEPLVRLWLLRLLISLGCHRKFIEKDGFDNDELAIILGLGHWIDNDDINFDPKKVRIELRKMYQNAERKNSYPEVSTILAKNIDRISKLVDLNKTDRRILVFAVLINNERILNDTFDWLGELTTVKVFQVLSVLLDVPEKEIGASLAPHNILARSGLVSVDRSCPNHLSNKLELLSDSFADNIYSLDTDPVHLLRDTVSLSSPPKLKIDDYDHISKELRILRLYLKKTMASKRKGVNIFIFGDPGTGKSQLARVLAKDLNCALFEVASEGNEEKPITGISRLRAFRTAQSFFAKRKVLILFDEAEDVFNDGEGIFSRSTAQKSKAWINQTLEENCIPTLWLSNSIEYLDNAFIRRFDMVLELPVPSRKQRRNILQDVGRNFLNEKLINHISESEMLSPAVAARAASVVNSIHDELGESIAPSAFKLIVNNTLKAQGHKPVRQNAMDRLSEIYDPKYISADSDLDELATGLMRSKAGRLCLYGPPGTGKTAYGRWIAEKMDVPLIVKRASDLISMWSGQTEKNMARAFETADSEDAVLLIDEVDSFLQDRRNAHRSWEVLQTNEMLTQMEYFSGVFIATTNLMDGLDQASLRRFDLKVNFDFMKTDQVWDLLNQYCELMDIQKPDSNMKLLVTSFTNLTPGDFAAVFRRNNFCRITSATDVIQALKTECKIKGGIKRSIGFT